MIFKCVDLGLQRAEGEPPTTGSPDKIEEPLDAIWCFNVSSRGDKLNSLNHKIEAEQKRRKQDNWESNQRCWSDMCISSMDERQQQ